VRNAPGRYQNATTAADADRREKDGISIERRFAGRAIVGVVTKAPSGPLQRLMQKACQLRF
jgi:hypothetical protein